MTQCWQFALDDSKAIQIARQIGIQAVVQNFKYLKLANTGMNSEPIRFANLVIIVVRLTNSILKPPL